ncbi:MAG TPA: thymidine phosphorylase [Balneola sp.]|jgi:pyrimidine-nucleoside phosphorylase|nr:thymidine phosphorylase [Bacteroidota bacterium]MAC04381.1 thymidine phosphorylase [Balneola sp.]MAO78397.1 thymidine phosphorylase [Balneola sp.]MBF64397.1 thymidine phosphorylase [Balneola sp.]HAW78836.1 thymidine phosphorylase [Balneola sp.]|tara:strand:- start:8894 stop:10237 length:1344 start_codon:yes stop_codon:yes gene_type:complete
MNSKYNIVSLIRKKRDGKVLSQDEIRFLIDSYTADEIPDYQISSFLMAAFLNGLNDEESAALTESMLHSGIVVDLSHVPGKKVDKHSTGGVGDKLSLILAPIVASAGVPVPMISGRGLGHTGGTLDKLESIPGFYVDVDLARYKEILEKQNLVLVGQTEEIAPADKRLYALRDVTATVESIPLIAGSIMSKKLAEGIDALVLDVKYGSGAFMKTEEDATKLAQALVGIGEQFEKETIAYLTNMKQPLGYKIGNWFEVEESVDALKGVGPDDIMELSHLLSGTMIYLGGKADSVEKGIEVSKQQVENGEAYQKWLDIVEEQGGDTSFIENTAKYPIAKFEFELKSSRDGYVTAMDAFEIGTASVELGAGRKIKEDDVDPQAGIVLKKKVGDKITKGETILVAYTNKPTTIEPVTAQLYGAIKIEDTKPEKEYLVTKVIDKNGVRDFRL